MKNGFSLLETLIAITVLIAAIMGPYTLASQSIKAAARAKNQTIAFFLAEEAMEYIRNKRDNDGLAGNDWLTSLGNCIGADGCFVDVVADSIAACSGTCPNIKYDSSNGLYGYVSGIVTNFTRSVHISQINSKEAKVEITITWQERLSNPSFVLEENLFDWP